MPEGATANFSKNIYTIFGKDHHVPNADVLISIFKVPKSLSAFKPEAQVPQVLGLGPYHHLRPELQQMQTYKHAEVKKLRKGFREISFKVLVGGLNRMLMQPIRACYEMYLDMDDEFLACIIGLFPFEPLCCYGISKGDLVQSAFFLHELVESSRRRLARVTALRDAMVLENQIPVLTVQVILKIEICSENKGGSHAKDDVTERFPLI